MEKIKFRGKDRDGNFIYGGFYKGYYGEKYIIPYEGDDCPKFISAEDVAQFVGYDADGKEIYEGDVLKNDSGGEFKASLKSIITSLKNPCYCRYLENLSHRKYYRLKERGKNENLS